MKKFLKSLMVMLGMCLIVYVGFVEPAIFMCRLLFYLWISLVLVLGLLFMLVPEKVADGMKPPIGKSVAQMYKDYLHEARSFSVTRMFAWASHICMVGMLVYGNYLNVAVLNVVILIVFNLGSRNLKTVAKSRLFELTGVN